LKILVCGSRHYSDYFNIYNVIKAFGADLTIISGACRGADKLAVEVAKKLGLNFREYPANWSLYGKKAGVIRNQQMIDLESPDLVIAFHTDIESSKGTKDMIGRAKYQGITTIIKD
jgi:YspA, cpYpsA-related SLOG family